MDGGVEGGREGGREGGGNVPGTWTYNTEVCMQCCEHAVRGESG